MQEKQIEAKLTQAAKMLGGIAPKFVSPGYDGMPDRIDGAAADAVVCMILQ